MAALPRREVEEGSAQAAGKTLTEGAAVQEGDLLSTGANGFVGKNLCVELAWRADVELFRFDIENKPEELDEIDRKILRELRSDGRLSNLKLAEKVGLSATPCWNRVRALEERGVIEGYAALLNHKAIGVPDTVIDAALPVQQAHHREHQQPDAATVGASVAEV